jgi:hypothetical protein
LEETVTKVAKVRFQDLASAIDLDDDRLEKLTDGANLAFSPGLARVIIG